MLIVHVSDCYAPRTGGIESQVGDLASRQAAAGHEVHVLTATLGVAGERGGVVDVEDGVHVHRLGARIPFDPALREASDAGSPVLEAAPTSEASEAIRALAEAVQSRRQGQIRKALTVL